MTTTSQSILDAIKASITVGQKDKLPNRVVTVFEERELKRRADMIVAGIEALTTAQTNLANVNKPDQRFTVASGGDADGQFLVVYSEKRTQEIDKAKKVVTDLTAALDKALADTPDFGPLEKLLKKGGGEDKSNPKND